MPLHNISSPEPDIELYGIADENIKRYLRERNAWEKEALDDFYNFDLAKSELIEFTTNTVAGAQDEVEHNLSYIPTGFIVVYRNKPGTMYDGGTDWTSTHIYTRYNAATVSVKILVY